VADPLLDWPRPLTDQPDAAFRRQFSDPGQCFHFMATLDDAQSENIPGTGIPRALATSAIVRCRDLLRTLLRRVVIEGGPQARQSAYGLYELMHAIGDSFSGAHAERRPGGLEIEYLRAWKPLERIAHLPLERSARIPPSAFHTWDDRRDKGYFLEDRVVTSPAGKGVPARQQPCGDLTAHPYEFPLECLSETGNHARLALVELLVVVRDLRRARLDAVAAGGSPDASPEESAAWRAYERKWFTAAYECQGEECRVRQPPDLLPGAYTLFGLQTAYNGSRHFLDVTAKGEILRYAPDLNPFVYVVDANLGYRSVSSGPDSGVAGLSLDLAVPLGKRASLGFTPAEWRIAFNGSATTTDIATRFFRFDFRLSDRLYLSLNGPVEINWRRPAVEWVVGLGVTYVPGRSQTAPESAFESHAESDAASASASVRQDDAWSPPPAPFGRLAGRRASPYVSVAVTTTETPDVSIPGRVYGLGGLGVSYMWDRDRWGGRFEWAPSLSLAVGSRRTSGESEYFVGVLGAGLRWYPLRILGLSVTPVRLEGGPKIRGGDEVDPSPDVHGDPGSQYYFQAGSRVGIAFNAGLVDLLVEAPTIAWRSKPFEGGEVLTFSLAIRLK